MLYEGSYVDDFTNFDKLVIFYEIKIQPIYEVENKDINDEIHEEFGFLLDEEINEVGYKVEFKVICRHRDKSVFKDNKKKMYKFEVKEFKEAVLMFVRALVRDKMFSVII